MTIIVITIIITIYSFYWNGDCVGSRFIEDNKRVENKQTAAFSINDTMVKKSLTSEDILFGPQLEKKKNRIDMSTQLLAVHPIKMSQSDPSECEENISALRKAHAILCEVSFMVNGMYGFQVKFQNNSYKHAAV